MFGLGDTSLCTRIPCPGYHHIPLPDFWRIKKRELVKVKLRKEVVRKVRYSRRMMLIKTRKVSE